MKAMVLTKADNKNPIMQLEELQIPKPQADEVLIRVRACGVCHSDLHVMRATQPFPVPAVLGHEVSGEILELGAATANETVERLKIGSRSVSPFIMPCGHCYYCVRNKEDICETFIKYNRGKGVLYDGKTRLFRKDGTAVAMYSMSGLAQYAVVPATAVYELSQSIPHPEAAILGCAIFTAYGAVRHAGEIRAGDNVAVIGTGGVGSNCLQIARAFGAHKIIAVDLSDNKLKAMKSLGATHVVNASKEKVSDAIFQITGGRGVDVAIEALGNPQTFKQTVESVICGGKAVMVGLAPVGVLAQVEITRIVRRGIKIIGSYGAKARSDMPAILALVEKGAIDVVSPITRRYSLADAERAYHDLHEGNITGRGLVDMHL